MFAFDWLLVHQRSMINDDSDFFRRSDAYRDALCAYLRGVGPINLLTELYGNIGDHLIWAGTRDLLSAGRVEFSELPVTDLHFSDPSRRFADETLVIPGSGAFTIRWHEWLPDLARKAAMVFRRVVILPSSYDVSVPIVAETLSRENVYAFAREPYSYRQIKHLGRAALAFDPALHCAAFRSMPAHSGAGVKTGRILVALRTDVGSLLPQQGYCPNPQRNDDISLTAVGLDSFLEAIRGAEVVITDRLHVAVATVMYGRDLVYIDPYDNKISTYFAFAFGDAFCQRIRRCRLAWLVEQDLVVPRQVT